MRVVAFYLVNSYGTGVMLQPFESAVFLKESEQLQVLLGLSTGMIPYPHGQGRTLFCAISS